VEPKPLVTPESLRAAALRGAACAGPVGLLLFLAAPDPAVALAALTFGASAGATRLLEERPAAGRRRAGLGGAAGAFVGVGTVAAWAQAAYASRVLGAAGDLPEALAQVVAAATSEPAEATAVVAAFAALPFGALTYARVGREREERHRTDAAVRFLAPAALAVALAAIPWTASRGAGPPGSLLWAAGQTGTATVVAWLLAFYAGLVALPVVAVAYLAADGADAWLAERSLGAAGREGSEPGAPPAG